MTPKQMIKLKNSILDISSVSFELGKYRPDSAEYISCLKQVCKMQQDIFDYLECLVEETNV